MKKILPIMTVIASNLLALPALADVVYPDYIPPDEADGNLTLALILLGFSGLVFLSGTALVVIIGIIAYTRKHRVHKPRS